MAETVEFEIGNSYADRHRNLKAQMGDRYEMIMREAIEDELHELTKDLERQIDAQVQSAPQIQGGSEDVPGEE